MRPKTTNLHPKLRVFLQTNVIVLWDHVRVEVLGRIDAFRPQKHCRKSIRLGGYDYSQVGEYFVTLCTHKMRCLFGEVKNGQVYLNRLGQIVEAEWRKTAHLRSEIDLGDFVVMQNHLHGLVVITKSRQKKTLADPVGRRAHGRAPL